MRGVPIPQVRTHKHLGLVLNESLTWSDHISSVYTACARMIGILRRLDGTIRSPAMKRIYTAVIRPRMEYAFAVWSGQSMRTGPDQGQIGPLLRRGFFCRERFARIFLSCPTPVLSGRISLQPITKLPSFLLKYFAVVLNYLPNEWILRGEAPGYWLRPVLSTRGEQLIPADDRKEETTLPYSFSP